MNKYWRVLGTNQLVADSQLENQGLRRPIKSQPSIVNVNNITIKIDAETFAKALQAQAQAQD
ncbi:MAG: hypothetical protein LPK00_07590 [Bacillaceae bacterium]|nr:hypothetical protein [Bacillaceae bacterium]